MSNCHVVFLTCLCSPAGLYLSWEGGEGVRDALHGLSTYDLHYTCYIQCMRSVEEQTPHSCDFVIFLNHMLEFIHNPPDLLKGFKFF